MRYMLSGRLYICFLIYNLRRLTNLGKIKRINNKKTALKDNKKTSLMKIELRNYE